MTMAERVVYTNEFMADRITTRNDRAQDELAGMFADRDRRTPVRPTRWSGHGPWGLGNLQWGIDPERVKKFVGANSAKGGIGSLGAAKSVLLSIVLRSGLLDWVGVGPDWIGLGWVGLAWLALDWVRFAWVGLG